MSVTFACVMAAVLIFGGVFGSIGIAMLTAEHDFSFDTADTHPYVGAAVGVGVAALALASGILVLAAVADAWRARALLERRNLVSLTP